MHDLALHHLLYLHEHEVPDAAEATACQKRQAIVLFFDVNHVFFAQIYQR